MRSGAGALAAWRSGSWILASARPFETCPVHCKSTRHDACRTRTEHAQNGQNGQNTAHQRRPVHRAPCAIRVSLLRLSLGTGAGHRPVSGCLGIGSCSRQASFARWATSLIATPTSREHRPDEECESSQASRYGYRQQQLAGSWQGLSARCPCEPCDRRPGRPAAGSRPLRKTVRRGYRLRDERRATIGAERVMRRVTHTTPATYAYACVATDYELQATRWELVRAAGPKSSIGV